MKFEHDFAGDAECWVRISDEVTPTGLSEAVAALLADPAFDGGEPQIWDLRDARFGAPDSTGREARDVLGAELAPRIEAPLAVVVNPEWDADTSASVYWLFCALPAAELFDDWDQGCRWLLANTARRAST
ncbi:MAG: hypothetical protein AAF515_15055 [Pseudomonadota bacterium]